MTDTRIKPEQAVHGATGGKMYKLISSWLGSVYGISVRNIDIKQTKKWQRSCLERCHHA
jgi:hypothetical protein